MACEHQTLTILNPWEFVRKYRCESCKAVMMCACDRAIAEAFLPHQLARTTENETGDEVGVTKGFLPRICNACRGLPPVANPVAAIHGRTSKFKRYYWRELFFEPRRRFMEWASARHLEGEWSALIDEHRNEFADIERVATADLKRLHERQPKYHYEREQSQAEVIAQFHVEVVDVPGTVVTDRDGGGARILDGADRVSPELFAERLFRRQGYEVLHTESVPFHALFGVLMWPLVEDRRDDEVREVFFGDRNAFEERRGGRPPLVRAHLPRDFGLPSYGRRRAAEIHEYVASLPIDTEALLALFEELLPGSFSLRQYLWAHRGHDVTRARTLIAVLGPKTVTTVLRYLATRYWERYLGWPDLLLYRASDFAFVEVKASRDKLSEDQKNWIRGNAESLHLPFRILKIHAAERR